MFVDGASVLYCKKQYEVNLGRPQEASLRDSCKVLSAELKRASVVNNTTFETFAICSKTQYFLMVFMMRKVPTGTHEINMAFILYHKHIRKQRKQSFRQFEPPICRQVWRQGGGHFSNIFKAFRLSRQLFLIFSMLLSPQSRFVQQASGNIVIFAVRNSEMSILLKNSSNFGEQDQSQNSTKLAFIHQYTQNQHFLHFVS